MLQKFFSSVVTICKKDLRIWMNQRVLIAATLLVPLSYLLVEYLGAAAVGRSPVALVVQDRGPIATQIASAINATNDFRITETNAQQAQILYKQLAVVAIITIPSNCSFLVETHQRAPIFVQVNNLNNDLTLDIRRAVPDAITTYYEGQGTNSPITTTVAEQDLRQQDVELFQYSVLPTIILLITTNGVITTGLAGVLEFEKRTIKELLLAPCSYEAIIIGKVLAGFITTFTLGTLMLVVGAVLGWTSPSGLYWFNSLLIIALGSLFASGLGVAVGAWRRRTQPVIFFSTVISVYLFSLAGGISVLAFDPPWLQTVAMIDPLMYAIHSLQMAVFYQSSDLLLRDVGVLLLASVIAIALGSRALRRSLAR